jgi:hypothetical protein
VPKHDVAIGTSGMSTLRTVGIMGTAAAGNLPAVVDADSG